MTDSSGRTATYTYYDPGGQLETETVTPPPGGVTTTYMYDTSGNVLSIIESDGPQTIFTYDADERLIKETETSNGVTDITTYKYDTDGNLISVTDPDGATTTFSYDAVGSLVSMVDPVAGATSVAGVPEPSTWAAMLLGFAGLVFAGRMRARRVALLSA